MQSRIDALVPVRHQGKDHFGFSRQRSDHIRHFVDVIVTARVCTTRTTNQSALVCNCRHKDFVQFLEVDFVALLNNISKSVEPVGEVMAWADNVCARLMGVPRGPVSGVEERLTLSSRSILIRWGYVTSQIMRDLVSSISFPRLIVDVLTRSRS